MSTIRTFRAILGLAAVCFGAQLTQAITINVTGASLTAADGTTPIPAGSTIVLIASRTNGTFGNLTSPNSASQAAFTNEPDDFVVARWSSSEGFTQFPVNFNLGDNGIGANNPLILVWYPNLVEATNPTGPGPAQPFGTYHTNVILDGSTSGWFVPGDNAATIDLNMLTTGAGGSLPEAAGAADQTTTGQPQNQPPVAQCKNVTNAANASCQATVTALQVDNSSFDPDGTISNLVLNPAGPFNLGSTLVTLTVIDNLGASNSCNATVVVQDQTAPTIVCPGNVSTSIPAGQTSAVVNYPAPSASDNCSSPTVTCAPPSGSTFALGSTNVSCRAVDAANLTNTCSFSLTVISSGANQPPVAQCKNITNAANANCQANVTVSQVNNGSFDPDGSITNRVLTPPGPFELGTTPVTLTVFDNQGASNSCNAIVVVQDQTAPTITCPGNVSTSVPAGQTSAVVNYPAPAVSDNCSTADLNCSPPSGSSFPLGMTTVNCTATDDTDNTSSCSFTVTVNAGGDNQPPVARCTNLTLVAGPRCMAVTKPRQVDNGSFDPNGRIVSRTLTPPGPYPLGDTAVILTVTDDIGATDSCPATITVLDQTPPTIQCPPDKVFTVPAGWSQRLIKFGVKARDNCSEPTVECSPPSGSFFPLGMTTVNCTATDGADQTSSCSFTVTVESVPDCRTISQLIAQIEASDPKSAAKSDLEHKLEEVVKKLDERDEKCSEGKPDDGQKKCGEALKKLDEFIKQVNKLVEEGKLDQATGDRWIECANYLKSQIVCPCGPDLSDIRS